MEKWLLGIVATLIAAGIINTVVMYGDLRDIKRQLTELQAREATDSKHWKYLSWCRQRINTLYQEQGLPIPPEPNLD